MHSGFIACCMDEPGQSGWVYLHHCSWISWNTWPIVVTSWSSSHVLTTLTRSSLLVSSTSRLMGGGLNFIPQTEYKKTTQDLINCTQNLRAAHCSHATNEQMKILWYQDEIISPFVTKTSSQRIEKLRGYSSPQSSMKGCLPLWILCFNRIIQLIVFSSCSFVSPGS